MAALTKGRNTQRAERGMVKSVPMAVTKIFAGAIACRNAAGYAVKGSTALGLVAIGRANEEVDNSGGSAGDLRIKVQEGVFQFANSASGDLIASTEIGKVCFIVDDQTVAKTSGSGTRSAAGIVVEVASTGVQVLMGEDVLADYRALRKQIVQARVTTLVGANSYYAVAPFGGRVTKIWSVAEGALTTGDATLQAKINGVNITTGLLTITQAGSAAGDIDSAIPTAANVVAAGDLLAVTVGGSNATATAANVIFEIERD